MFGYIKPFKPELKIRDYESYKAVYCGLCDVLGRSFGVFSRLTLSYDFVFLSMLYSCVSKAEPVFEKARCCVNPFVKVNMSREKDALSFSADIAAIMLYHKLLDNIQDSRRLKSAAWKLLLPFAGAGHKKAVSERPEPGALIARCMELQRRTERDKNSGIDAACEPSALIMSGVFSQLSEDRPSRRILERMGYLIGRYVYLCDALDDLEEDRRNGGFNPFLQKYGYAKIEKIIDEAKASLYLTAGEFELAFDLLEPGPYYNVLENIAHIGLRAQIDGILRKKEKGVGK